MYGYNTCINKLGLFRSPDEIRVLTFQQKQNPAHTKTIEWYGIEIIENHNRILVTMIVIADQWVVLHIY